MSAMRNAIAGDCYNPRHSDQCGWSKEVDSPVVGRYLSLETSRPSEGRFRHIMHQHVNHCFVGWGVGI